MIQSFTQNLLSNRIGGREFGKSNGLFKFEKIKQAKRQAMLMNPSVDLIDLGVGEPDWMADQQVVLTLAEEAGKWGNRGYADNGSPNFKEAAAAYMKQIYGVDGLDPLSEINHCMGSKAALAQLPAAFINPGDVTLMTVPGYPILGTHTEWLGGTVVNLPLTPANRFLPDLDSIPDEIKKRAKLLYINYPNNPTGATADVKFYENVVRFAKENQVIVISDEAYGAVTFDTEKPKGAFFLYVEVPKSIEGGPVFESAEDFSQYLIREKAISTVPWDDAGRYIRLSVTFIAEDEEDEIKVIQELKNRLCNVSFVW